ncbi:MAG: Pre-mRNA-splicing factor cwc26 [Pleopsidium flavum]|nr:MAG: Pre-mRNA-splicing factor cwc26 [Pleopsidium flavum]
MSLADYLAKNYLTADASTDKKGRKRKRKSAQTPATGLIIADDDALGWNSNNGTARDDDDGPVTVGINSAEFRKKSTNNWTTIGAPIPSSTDQAAADAIIASAAAENTARDADDDSAPAIDSSALTMESGAHAGLQSAEAVTAQLRLKQAAERRRFEQDADSHSGRGQETIYRDASGRIINVAMKRAEARKKAEEEAARKVEEVEAQKGDVQRAEAARRREEVREARFLGVARGVDDVEMNEELRGRERWDDPMAGMLSSSGKEKKGAKGEGGKEVYKGAAMPNRYGIRPGCRWDGVDRGNGFEKEYFAARNRRRNLKELDYAWQMDE